MNEDLLLQHFQELNLEEGKTYLQRYCDESADCAAISDRLEKEALGKLYTPFISLKLAELLIFLGEYVHDSASYALGQKAKGDALVQIGHFKAAMESLDEAGMVFRQLGDEGNWARSRISWIVACAWLGNIDEALRQGELARQAFLHLGEPFWAATIDLNTAVIYDHAGRYQEALELYKRMRVTYLSLSDQRSPAIQRNIALVDLNQAINLARLGQMEQAYLLQSQARDRFRLLGEINLELIAEVNIADLNYMQGFYGSALRGYYHALDVLQHSPLDDPWRIARLKLWIADCLVKLNRAQEARQLSNEAVMMQREFGISLNTGLALLTHATTLAACGEVKQAIAVLSEAQELFDRTGFQHHSITTLLQKIEFLLKVDDASSAYDQAQLARQICESRGLEAYVVRTELYMASALLAMATQSEASGEHDARLDEAVGLCKHLIPIAHTNKLQEVIYKSYYLLGRIASLQGYLTKASRYYQAAIAQIERILDDLLYDLSPAFLSTAWEVYADMVAFSLEQKQVERAFVYLEQARSMALRQYLIYPKLGSEEAQDGRSTISPTLLRVQKELKDWQDRYRRYSFLLANIDPSVSSSVSKETLQMEISRCERNISELFERLSLYREEWPLTDGVSRSRKRPEQKRFDVIELRKSLAEHQTLLAYFLHKGKLIIFAMNAQTLFCHEVPDGVKQLESILPFFYARIQEGAQYHQRLSQQRIIRAFSEKLYDLLIAPVRTLLPDPLGLLTIVPYDHLHRFPFHALFNGKRFLIEDFQIHYLPTSSLLSPNALSKSESKNGSPLIFGYSGKGQLHHALEEAKFLASILQGKCSLEEEATIIRLEQEAPGSPIIHIATHGQSRHDAPNFSSVLLADGQLNAIDAFHLDLQSCELVTLSGCETSFSLFGGGDEQLGLGRAFLAAGAKALVMSLWPVEDEKTSEFMELFYSRLLQGASKVEALRQAQCAFLSRSESAYTHPYFWAAFRLVGDIHALKWEPPIGATRTFQK